MGAAPALRGFAAGHGKSRRAPNGEARGPFAKFGSALGFRGLEENRVLTAAPVGHCPRRLDAASAAATGVGPAWARAAGSVARGARTSSPRDAASGQGRLGLAWRRPSHRGCRGRYSHAAQCRRPRVCCCRRHRVPPGQAAGGRGSSSLRGLL